MTKWLLAMNRITQLLWPCRVCATVLLEYLWLIVSGISWCEYSKSIMADAKILVVLKNLH